MSFARKRGEDTAAAAAPIGNHCIADVLCTKVTEYAYASVSEPGAVATGPKLGRRLLFASQLQ
jgi:hypothetical protein